MLLPKKTNASKCEEYRTLSLITHASKILTRIVTRRIEGKIEENLSEDQFSFKKGRGTREAILCVRQITEKRLNKGEKTYMAFVDLDDDTAFLRFSVVCVVFGQKVSYKRLQTIFLPVVAVKDLLYNYVLLIIFLDKVIP